MENISFETFIENWKDKFDKINDEKYISKSFYISFSNIYDATKKEANDINGFKEILDSNNSDDIMELHNSILSFILGNGGDYQANFEANNGNWNIDFGKSKIEEDEERINYHGINLYLGEKYQ